MAGVTLSCLFVMLPCGLTTRSQMVSSSSNLYTRVVGALVLNWSPCWGQQWWQVACSCVLSKAPESSRCLDLVAKEKSYSTGSGCSLNEVPLPHILCPPHYSNAVFFARNCCMCCNPFPQFIPYPASRTSASVSRFSTTPPSTAYSYALVAAQPALVSFFPLAEQCVPLCSNDCLR